MSTDAHDPPTDRDTPRPSRGGHRGGGGGGARAAVAVAALLALFAALAWTAARTKSMTFDEPMHALGAWLWTHERDYRFDPEDPPLWGYWMSLPNGRDALRVNFTDPAWAATARTHWTRQDWWRSTLHGTPGNDPNALVRRARNMALVIGVLLGGTIAWYAWRLGGAVAAVLAAALYAFDPNFLGHAPLVKNDVVISLAFLALAYALWRAGTRLTPANALAVCVLCGVAMSVKFSGILALPMTAAVLLTRALLPAPWPVLRRRTLPTRGRRLLATALVGLAVAVVSVTVVWASYGFRYRAIPDGTPMNIGLQAANAVYGRMRAADPTRQPTMQELQAAPRGVFVETVLALNQHHLMPEAWLNGLLYTYQTSLIRPSYLLGEVRINGWWYYFPLAMAYKTPLATLALAAVAAVLGWRLRDRPRNGAGGDDDDHDRAAGDAPGDLAGADARFPRRWALLCLLLPAGIYLLVALRTNLNLGLRHVLPLYPPLYVAIACALAEAWRRRVQFVRPATLALVALLAAETLLNWPNYVAFFNLAAGGTRGGIRLLGDSNLDWGQDLPALARWHEANPDRPIHLRYFGSADPADFLDAHTVNPMQPQLPAPPAVIAVSATFLQGLYVPEPLRPFYDALRRQRPLAVLGGTIYVFEPPPTASTPLAPAPAPAPATSPATAPESAASARAASTTATAPSGTSTSP